MTTSLHAPLIAAAPWWQPHPGRALRIRGGRPLAGAYPISGAKNAVLPLIVSALLTPHLVTLHNVPATLDVAVLAALLKRLGANLQWSQAGAKLSLTISADRVHSARIDPDLVARMRASVLLLGALLARCGEVRLPMPGGDAIGHRPIDFHVAGLQAMGAKIELTQGMVHATAPSGLHGADIRLPRTSVGATQNLMLAAVAAEGTTVIRNAAREPEVAELADCLSALGADITGRGSDVLTIRGGMPLKGAVHQVMPDRIELGTLVCAAALTDGELFLESGSLELLGAAAPLLAAAGIVMLELEDGLLARRADGGIRGIDVTTQPFPGFATDLQAPTMALLAVAKGASTITETIFEQRFWHVDELHKMGASITVVDRTVLIRGVPALSGAPVRGSDIRAAGALVIAGLGAVGETIVDGLDHLDRGYDRMTEKLAACGADIVRV